jgi:hypothetical protein
MLGKETEVNDARSKSSCLSLMPQFETYRSSDWTNYSFVVDPLLVDTVRSRRFAAIVRNTLDWNLVIR